MALLLTEWDKQIMDACDIHKTTQKIETIFVSFLWCTIRNQIRIISIHDQQSYKEYYPAKENEPSKSSGGYQKEHSYSGESDGTAGCKLLHDRGFVQLPL